jgi:hypothetical protein
LPSLFCVILVDGVHGHLCELDVRLVVVSLM